ncbi:hypothetical protein [uncultured Cohaesibacter sp.]|nr:hypothetical protein [uncultured Cohaesibacter sp.]
MKRFSIGAGLNGDHDEVSSDQCTIQIRLDFHDELAGGFGAREDVPC